MEQWLERLWKYFENTQSDNGRRNVDILDSIDNRINMSNLLKIEELRILRKIHNIPEDF